MRPNWPEKKPYRYFTPASGELVFDYVAGLPEAKVAAKRTNDGYMLGVVLPWKALGITPRTGLELPFDAQVIFSNPAGNANAASLWWRSVGGGASAIWDIVAEAGSILNSGGRRLV